MTGYTKLFSSIIASTIWRANDKTRIVWITMLAMADQFGIVEASVPGLADMARVTTDECRSALSALSDPDKDSRSKEQDGRRVEEVDGGWRLINHGKYRDKMSRDERREYQRLYQRSYRKRSVNSDYDKLTKFDIQKQKQNITDTEERTSDSPATSAEPPILIFPTIGKVKAWSLTQPQIDSWAEAYPGHDILAECRKALVWVEANKRKTAGGMPKFLVSWLARSVDRPSAQPHRMLSRAEQALESL